MDSSKNTQKAVWLDCDPGLDDTFAIILAGYNPSIKLIGISTTQGNTNLENTSRNACRVLHASGIENVPVIKGVQGPLFRDEYNDDDQGEVAEDVHGKDGLSTKEGESFPTDVPLKPITSNAIVTMYDKIKNYPEKVHLVATGALTNVALLFKVFPDVMENIEQLVFMGGAINYGNITPSAEANMIFDPEAAALVFKTKIKKVMVPLDVTHQVWVNDDVMKKIKSFNTRYTNILHGMLLFYRDAYHKIYEFDYSPLHDPCTIAYLIDSTMFKE
mmetsp:Transcript_4169/g.3525  ORF Transcript_4169/g.3525 Transcript_4169/m.3525 type:complete len:273 (+) Transcript_4169:52-870(+)|eukprot:CAMPEP_0114582664 /NCGR_PEP_ID=MMETSP0125-20121206/6590_1 /TAXON_ID=485358 ORGANISM="Aristerostoma sp., Strain ATCC 50986" /NCGR_SAMPLE_ID=MMETSP0125 /ASSEMBLY_ACC=CAM_ASM_000245 /LENGTH=272 /DNA_ID=CAMNT_0001775733 /DNA_START=52 /DNA_END=870 /DNA_ORIENTATION=-